MLWNAERAAYFSLKLEAVDEVQCVIVEVHGRCTEDRTRVVGEEHHTSGLRKVVGEKVCEPELVVHHPCFLCVIRLRHGVEAVDSHDASRMVCQRAVKTGNKRAKRRTRFLQQRKAGLWECCQR